MVSNLPGRAAVAGTTFVLWALVAASVVAWGLKLSAGPSAPPAPTAPRAVAPIDTSSVARLLGSNPGASAAPAVNIASRYSLIGVVAMPGHEGVALIGVDGKPARHFRVGAPVDDNLVLKSVDAKQASLGPAHGPATVTLDLPQRPMATIGSAPAAAQGLPPQAGRGARIPQYPSPAPASQIPQPQSPLAMPAPQVQPTPQPAPTAQVPAPASPLSTTAPPAQTQPPVQQGPAPQPTPGGMVLPPAVSGQQPTDAAPR